MIDFKVYSFNCVLFTNIHLQVTASGDQTARLWDVITGDLLGTFKGHQCSLKSVAFSKQETGNFTIIMLYNSTQILHALL